MHVEDYSNDEAMMRLVEMLRTMASATDTRVSIAAYLQGWVKSLRPGTPEHFHLITRGLRSGQYRIFLRGTETLDLPPEKYPHPESLPIHTGGFFGEMMRSPVPKLVRNLHITNDPVLENNIAEYRSVFCFPVFGATGIDEWLFIFFYDHDPARRQLFEQNMIQSNLLSVQNRAIIMAEHLRQANTYIQREVEQIAAIQRALLPHSMPEIQGVSLAASYATFDRAGGDYYDFIPFRRTAQGPDPAGKWAAVIADASGHGPAAAVVISMLHALLHSHHDLPESPSVFLEDLNAHLPSKRIGGAFITAWLGIYDPQTLDLRYASAGHDAPLLMRRGREASMDRLRNTSGFPLGICDRVNASDESLQLEPGDTLVLFTDGITEARNPAGKMFTVEGVETALRECNGLPHCVTENVLDVLRDHEAGRRPADDQTIVAMRIDD